MKKKILASVVILALAASSAWAAERPAAAVDGDLVTAAINAGAARLGRKVGLPNPLSPTDAEAYQRAFAAQDQGDWNAADAELRGVSDHLLVGQVLGQRYLDPRYKASFKELQAWLAEYSDHADATALYHLAQSRQVRNGGALKPPARRPTPGASVSDDDDGSSWDIGLPESGRSHQLKALRARFRGLVRAGHMDAAEALLSAHEVARADKADVDDLKTLLALGHYRDGNDQLALKWAQQAAERSGDRLPGAHWVAALVYWRAGDTAAARPHFEEVANSQDSSPWMTAAGAFWAARANLVNRRPNVVNHWLDMAASYPRTFYGMLARRALGEAVSFTWDNAPLTDLDVAVLTRVPGGRRALALLQLHQHDRAESELRTLYPDATPAVAQSMLVLANTGGMPELALKLATVMAERDGRSHDTAAYPLPEWQPTNGWTVDRALIMALARQESKFNPHARSPAGAVGLMQLMPATARAMGASGSITDPAGNLALGQHYVRHLLDADGIRGNLVMLTASYNSGPGNVTRWQQTVRHNDDPLLFIESIPSPETRMFVERVLTSYWIYQSRLGQTSPSLDSMVSGKWPIYQDPTKAVKVVPAAYGSD